MDRIGLKEYIDKYGGLAVALSKDSITGNYIADYITHYNNEKYNSSVMFTDEDAIDLNSVTEDVVNSFEIYFAELQNKAQNEVIDGVIEDVTPDQLKEISGFEQAEQGEHWGEHCETIQIKYHSDKIDRLAYIDGKSDWIDLRAAEDVELKKGEVALIPLSISVKLPDGYEAWIAPRSSTFKNYGIIQTNSIGR